MPKLKQCPYQLIIAIDQLFNALAFGWADETFSARCWRQKEKNVFWRCTCGIVNTLFFWDVEVIRHPVIGPNTKIKHCEKAYLNEVGRQQCPPEYRKENNV